MIRRVLLAAVAGLAMLGGGCTSGEGGGGVTVKHDEQLSQQLRDLSERGGTARLADLTDFRWDQVHVFSEGATAKEVEQVVGKPVLDGNRYYDAGNLLVFMDGGNVTAALSVLPDLLVTGGEHTWGSDTVLQPRTEGRPSALRLTKPS